MFSPTGGRLGERGGGAERTEGGREEGEDRLREKERVDTNVSLSGGSVRVFAVCTSRLGRGIQFRSSYFFLNFSALLALA